MSAPKSIYVFTRDSDARKATKMMLHADIREHAANMAFGAYMLGAGVSTSVPVGSAIMALCLKVKGVTPLRAAALPLATISAMSGVAGLWFYNKLSKNHPLQAARWGQMSDMCQAALTRHVHAGTPVPMEMLTERYDKLIDKYGPADAYNDIFEEHPRELRPATYAFASQVRSILGHGPRDQLPLIQTVTFSDALGIHSAAIIDLSFKELKEFIDKNDIDNAKKADSIKALAKHFENTTTKEQEEMSRKIYAMKEK